MTWGNVAIAGGSIIGGILGSKGNKTNKALTAAQVAQAQAETQALQQKTAGFGTLWDQAQKYASADPSTRVAGFNDDQLAAQEATRQNLGFGQNELAQIQERLTGMTGGVTSADVQQWMNPYQQSVIDATMGQLDTQRQRSLADNSSGASLAFSDSNNRRGVADALTNEYYGNTAATTLAGLNSANYSQALGQANTNYGLQMQGNDQLAQLINQRRAAMGSDTAALATSGDAQQANAQALLNVPGQNLNLLNAILAGYNPSGSNFSGVQSTDSVSGAIAGASAGGQMGQGLSDLWSKIFASSGSSSTGASAGNGYSDSGSGW